MTLHQTLVQPAPSSPLLVLDTNVVLDWIAFDDARVRPIVAAIEHKAVCLVSNEACLQELRRVLTYSQVKLEPAARAAALARYVAHARMFVLAAATVAAGVPRCEDPDDQKFLDLAWHAHATHLVTRDNALLKLARRLVELRGFAVLAPDAFMQWMSGPEHS